MGIPIRAKLKKRLQSTKPEKLNFALKTNKIMPIIYDFTKNGDCYFLITRRTFEYFYLNEYSMPAKLKPNNTALIYYKRLSAIIYGLETTVPVIT